MIYIYNYIYNNIYDIYIYILFGNQLMGELVCHNKKKKLGVMVDVSVVTWGWKPTDQSTSQLI